MWWAAETGGWAVDQWRTWLQLCQEVVERLGECVERVFGAGRVGVMAGLVVLLAQVQQMVLGVRVAIPWVCTHSLQHRWQGWVGYTRTGGWMWLGLRAPLYFRRCRMDEWTQGQWMPNTGCDEGANKECNLCVNTGTATKADSNKQQPSIAPTLSHRPGCNWP